MSIADVVAEETSHVELFFKHCKRIIEAIVHDLFDEYLKWACAALYREYGVTFDAEAILEHDMSDIGIFLPPVGRLLLAYDDAVRGGLRLYAHDRPTDRGTQTDVRASGLPS